jgi:hypothetical protein
MDKLCSPLFCVAILLTISHSSADCLMLLGGVLGWGGGFTGCWGAGLALRVFFRLVWSEEEGEEGKEGIRYIAAFAWCLCRCCGSTLLFRVLGADSSCLTFTAAWCGGPIQVPTYFVSGGGGVLWGSLVDHVSFLGRHAPLKRPITGRVALVYR